MHKIKLKEKCFDLLIFFLFYLISYVIGYFTSFYIEDIILRLFLFDVISTFIIYLLSLVIKNSSLDDAYWSLTPWVMLTYLIILNCQSRSNFVQKGMRIFFWTNIDYNLT